MKFDCYCPDEIVRWLRIGYEEIVRYNREYNMKVQRSTF